MEPLKRSANPSASELSEEAIEVAVFAWEWARMLVGTSWIVADRTVIASELRELTLQLVATLEEEPSTPSAGISVGQKLVEMGFASPDALSHTVTLLGLQFLPALGLTHVDRDRLDVLIGRLSLGFVRAFRDRTLEQQDAIRSSALLALERTRADQRASALRDDVTGLPNRGGFTAALEPLLSAHPRGVVGICVLALGGFEALDRGLGRSVGDQLLATVAARLVNRFAGEHELVARVGRGEFLVAAVDGDHDPDALAKRITAAQDTLRESIVLNGTPIMLSTSFGVVARAVQQTDPEVILRDADLAVSWARSRGPGSVQFFDVERAALQISELRLTAEIPGALDDGSLQPHYQPIVSLQTGRIDTVEALVRWVHPEHGLLAPDRFLHLAARGGLMSTLGRAVLRHACRQGRAWQQTLAQPPVIAVNLSESQLIDFETVRDVITILEETGLPAELLQLEITEHAALNDPATLEIIGDLSKIGVGLALDDFGTGQAHMSRLGALPGHGVRTLKLPADFLHPAHGIDVADDPLRRLIMATTINLSHDLGLQVTVEGVETAAHDALVRELGADLAQGSFYYRPEPAATISWQLRTGHTV
jgi:diguanylate cyclase (GGDEF)-like protein